MSRLETPWRWRLDVAAAGLAVLAGVSMLAATSGPAAALDSGRQKELVDLVRQDCGSCHGMTMRGGLGRPLLPERFKDVDRDVLASIILNGVRGTPMPPWAGLLSVEEATWIADQLKTGLPQ